MNDQNYFDAISVASRLALAVIDRKPPAHIESLWHKLRLILFSQPPPRKKKR